MNDEQRGEEARRLLDNPLYLEALRTVEDRLVNELARLETDRDKAEFYRLVIAAGRAHRKYVEQVAVTGTLVALEEERKRTLRDRLLKR